jgi:hypothetical protein
MRFSTLAAISAAALASSAAAYPSMYDYDLAARADEDLLDLRSLLYDDEEEVFARQSGKPARAPGTATKSPKAAKPLASLANAERKKAQKEFKDAEMDLAAAKKLDATSGGKNQSGKKSGNQNGKKAGNQNGKPLRRRATPERQTKSPAAAAKYAAAEKEFKQAEKDLSDARRHRKMAAQKHPKAPAALAMEEEANARKQFKDAAVEFGGKKVGSKVPQDKNRSSQPEQSAPKPGKKTASAPDATTTKPVNKRTVDIDELLEIIARGYYGDFDEEY